MITLKLTTYILYMYIPGTKSAVDSDVSLLCRPSFPLLIYFALVFLAGSPSFETGSPSFETGSPSFETGFPSFETGFPSFETGFPSFETGFPSFETATLFEVSSSLLQSSGNLSSSAGGEIAPFSEYCLIPHMILTSLYYQYFTCQLCKK